MKSVVGRLTAETSLMPTGQYWPNIKLQKKLTRCSFYPFYALGGLAQYHRGPYTQPQRRSTVLTCDGKLRLQHYTHSGAPAVTRHENIITQDIAIVQVGVDKALFRSSSVGLTRSKGGLKGAPAACLELYDSRPR